MATGRISSLVMMQPHKIFQTMLFEMIFLLDSYSRRSLKNFGWYGLSDTFTKTWSGGLSWVFVVSSLPTIVVDGSKFFSFPSSSLVLFSHTFLTRFLTCLKGFKHQLSLHLIHYLFCFVLHVKHLLIRARTKNWCNPRLKDGLLMRSTGEIRVVNTNRTSWWPH